MAQALLQAVALPSLTKVAEGNLPLDHQSPLVALPMTAQVAAEMMVRAIEVKIHRTGQRPKRRPRVVKGDLRATMMARGIRHQMIVKSLMVQRLHPPIVS